MRSFLFTLLGSLLLLGAEAQLKTPAASPSQTIKQDFGLGSIEVSYARPGVKNRKILGNVVPFGSVWRTGANNATTLQFTDEVTIGGVKIAPGKYGLLTIPTKDNWTIIISNQTDVTSPAAYKQEMDLVRLTAPVQSLKYRVENFTILIDDVKPTSCVIGLQWDKTKVSFPITTDIDEKMMKSISVAMSGQKPPYYSAALYYLENGKNLEQALAWFDKAVQANANAYWIQHQRANCLAKMGRKSEAIAAAEKSKELAVAAKNNDYVKLNEKLIASLK
ncbi:MAG: DUF2911 domain-containing protein [Chitinophagaceae bacterium]